MSAQTSYNYSMQIGAAGGIVDLAPYAIDTRINEEDTGTMKFGMAVCEGTTPGKTIAIPSATAAVFEGVTVNNRSTELDIDGNLAIRKNAAVGVMRYGRVYVRVSDGVTPAYGDNLYMITSGDEAGYFTNASADGTEVKGRFLSAVDSTAQIAMAELFMQ